MAASVLAEDASRYLPDDSTLAALRPVFMDEFTVITEPEGALVYLESFVLDETADVRRLIGTTPIVDMELPRGEYRALIEMDGFESLERPVSSALNQV